MDPTFPLVPIMNFISAFLVLIPFTIGLLCKTWNLGVWVSAMWIIEQSISTGVNSILWANNVNDLAPVWCDISSHFDVAANVGIPACSLVITRHFYRLTRQPLSATGPLAHRFSLLIDCFICLGLPVIVTGLYYIVQSNRYLIFEEIGCQRAVKAIGASNALLDIWQVLLPLISICYSVGILLKYYHQHKAYKDFRDADLVVGHRVCFRLLAIACMDAVITLPLCFPGVVTESKSVIPFWPGWTVIHEDWDEIGTFPTGTWRSDFWLFFIVEWTKWKAVPFSFIFFVLFGLTRSARLQYRRTWQRASWHLGLRQSQPEYDFNSAVLKAATPRSRSQVINQDIFSRSTQDSFYTHNNGSRSTSTQPFTPLPELQFGVTDLTIPEPLPNRDRIIGLAF